MFPRRVSPPPPLARRYVPAEDDGCYSKFGSSGGVVKPEDSVCWWHMADGAVLGTGAYRPNP